MTNTPSIPGIDRNALAAAIRRDPALDSWSAAFAADAALAYIAAHHECACDRENDDEWVEVETWDGLPDGVRLREEWTKGGPLNAYRFYVHRDDMSDDLPDDPDAEKIERMAQEIHSSYYPNFDWDMRTEEVRDSYRKAARAALAVSREDEETR